MYNNFIRLIENYSFEGTELRKNFFADNAEKLCSAADKIVACVSEGNKIFLCGNGGSAADAQHIAAEFVNRFLVERPAIPAIALTTDTSILTSIGNDRQFDQIFSRQLEALCKKGDILIAISTSGNSPNIVNALDYAHTYGIYTIGFSGKGGGIMREYCDMLFEVPSIKTPLIQEIHIAIGHLLCTLVDEIFCSKQ